MLKIRSITFFGTRLRLNFLFQNFRKIEIILIIPKTSTETSWGWVAQFNSISEPILHYPWSIIMRDWNCQIIARKTNFKREVMNGYSGSLYKNKYKLLGTANWKDPPIFWWAWPNRIVIKRGIFVFGMATIVEDNRYFADATDVHA